MTAVYLEREIQKLQQPRSTHENPKQLIFKWTDKKIDLVELIYALYASRSLNNGKVDIADIATFFEKSFQLEIGDVYRKYIEIKNRKFETTKYLDHLSEILRKKIEDEL
jgi:hypothetical protein